jgi:RimJ/RimL family protein N-acetyltransferase
MANIGDAELYFQWANDKDVRHNSFSPDAILFENHMKWFAAKLASDNTLFLLFFNNAEPVGQLRIDIKDEHTAEIDYSVSSAWRGKGLGQQFLEITKELLSKLHPQLRLKGVVKAENVASLKAFEYAGFIQQEPIVQQGNKCHLFYSK